VVNLREIAELPVSGAGVLAFSPDGDRLAVGLFDGGLVEVLDLGTGQSLFTLQGHRNSRILSYLSFSPEGDELASGSQGWSEADDSVILWDLITGRATRIIEGSLGAVSPDWRTLVLTTRQDPAGASLLILALDNNETLFELPARSDIYGFSFSPDGNLAAGKMFAVYQDLFTFWDVRNGREVRTIFDWKNFAYSPDGRFLAAVLDAGSDPDSGELTVFEASSWKNLRTLGQGADRFWYALPAFSPDGSLLAASFGDQIRLWDTETWELLTRIPMPDVVGLTFSPDGRLLVAYSQNHPVVLLGILPD
jgi:WD40 repeat protein